MGNPPGPIGITADGIKTDNGTLARVKTSGPGPTGLSAKSGGENPTPDTLRALVVAFARQKLGDWVGNGECFDLADLALRDAGAKSAADFGQVTPTANYRWGTTINLSQLRAGDIIQFRNYRFDRNITEADGRWAEDFQERLHHTAVVDSVDGGGAVTVLEQNVPPGAEVTQCQLFFSNSQSDSNGTQTNITVHGQFWFYRPQPR